MRHGAASWSPDTCSEGMMRASLDASSGYDVNLVELWEASRN